jgi:hypothetical protein
MNPSNKLLVDQQVAETAVSTSLTSTEPSDFKSQVMWHEGPSGIELYSNKNITIRSDQHIILMSGNTTVDDTKHPGLRYSIWLNPTQFDSHGNPIPDQEFYTNAKRGHQEMAHAFHRLKKRVKNRNGCSCSLTHKLGHMSHAKHTHAPTIKHKRCCS